MQGYVYQKYYLKINFLFLKIYFIYRKDKKKIIDESEKSLQKLNEQSKNNLCLKERGDINLNINNFF